jgi:hypothetical protein
MTLSLVIVLILIGGVILVYPYLAASNSNPLSNNMFLTRGHVTYYAYGSSTSTPVALSESYRLTGGFDTNSSVIFYVMTSQQFESQSPEFKSPVSYYYSTGNVKSAAINTTLYAGDYDLVFRFVNDTGRLVTTFNGTSLVSTTTVTITQTFALTPTS